MKNNFDKSVDLVYRDNVIFEVYRTCLQEGISSGIFMKIKEAINSARKIDINEALYWHQFLNKPDSTN